MLSATVLQHSTVYYANLTACLRAGNVSVVRRVLFLPPLLTNLCISFCTLERGAKMDFCGTFLLGVLKVYKIQY